MSTIEHTPYQFESTIPYTDQDGARHSVAMGSDGRLVNVTERPEPDKSILDPSTWTCYQGQGGVCRSCNFGPCHPAGGSDGTANG